MKIELRDASKVFANPEKGTSILALEKTTFGVCEEEIVCLLGPSGCGKTTILNLLAGFEYPSAGQVMLNGREISSPGKDRGVIFQEHALFPWLTVQENINFGPRMQRLPKQRYLQQVQELIDLVGLQGFDGHYPHELSGGMRQRVAIARALMTEPDVLLMDEPFGALDAMTRANMQQLVLNVWERLKPTILFVTHDIDEAVFLGDRILVMTARPGRIKAEVRVTLMRPRPYRVVTTEGYQAIKRQVLDLVWDALGE